MISAFLSRAVGRVRPGRTALPGDQCVDHRRSRRGQSSRLPCPPLPSLRRTLLAIASQPCPQTARLSMSPVTPIHTNCCALEQSPRDFTVFSQEIQARYLDVHRSGGDVVTRAIAARSPRRDTSGMGTVRTADGTDIYCKNSGEGRPIVFSHRPTAASLRETVVPCFGAAVRWGRRITSARFHPFQQAGGESHDG